MLTSEFSGVLQVGPSAAKRTTLPSGKGGVVHLFVVYGCQGAEKDADQLLLTDKLLQAVFG